MLESIASTQDRLIILGYFQVRLEFSQYCNFDCSLIKLGTQIAFNLSIGLLLQTRNPSPERTPYR